MKETILALSPQAKILLKYLWPLADRKGRLNVEEGLIVEALNLRPFKFLEELADARIFAYSPSSKTADPLDRRLFYDIYFPDLQGLTNAMEEVLKDE